MQACHLSSVNEPSAHPLIIQVRHFHRKRSRFRVAGCPLQLNPEMFVRGRLPILCRYAPFLPTLPHLMTTLSMNKSLVHALWMQTP